MAKLVLRTKTIPLAKAKWQYHFTPFSKLLRKKLLPVDFKGNFLTFLSDIFGNDMTRMIINIKNNNDISFLKEIADRMELSYRLEEFSSSGISDESLSRIMKGVDISVFGNPSEWQQETRRDRKISPIPK